ncbi:GNAT family N-acetyltransferase [Roseovarius aquimarinus]|uniref:GNAT family N-acetyltransferase n=1 Tax=Roseovarius aquimarinus TaxID=1229156 RepID=A0ABW7I5B3_9RHOB
MTRPLPDAARLYEVIEATWPPAARWTEGAWTLRDGQGGGKRVSAATANGDVAKSDLPVAEAAMRKMGQAPLFMLRAGEEALDALLAGAGYAVVDPVNIHAIRLADLHLPAPERLAAFHLWEPLAIQCDIWAAGGIGPARIEVMRRAAGPKTALLGRLDGRAVATGFAAIHEGTAMVHALEVLPEAQRRGVGRTLMAEAARWARAEGAETLSVICTAANAAANALYSGIGMAHLGRYHYRQHRGSAS